MRSRAQGVGEVVYARPSDVDTSDVRDLVGTVAELLPDGGTVVQFASGKSEIYAPTELIPDRLRRASSRR